jgi:hypothetical protein
MATQVAVSTLSPVSIHTRTPALRSVSSDSRTSSYDNKNYQPSATNHSHVIMTWHQETKKKQMYLKAIFYTGDGNQLQLAFERGDYGRHTCVSLHDAGTSGM